MSEHPRFRFGKHSHCVRMKGYHRDFEHVGLLAPWGQPIHDQFRYLRACPKGLDTLSKLG